MGLLSIFFITCIINAILNLIMGLVVYFRNRHGLLNIVWSLLCLVVAFWSLGLGMMTISKTQEAASFWLYLPHFFSVNFMCSIFLHFCLILVNKHNSRKYLIIACYLLSCVFQILTLKKQIVTASSNVLFRYFPKAAPLFPFFIVGFYAMFIYAIYQIIRGIFSTTGQKRMQLKYFLFSSIVGLVMGSTAFFPIVGIPIYPFGIHVFSIYTILISYTILRYKLIDVNLFIKRSSIYTIMILLNAMIYFAIIFLVEHTLQLFFIQFNTVVTRLPAIIVIAFTFSPIRSRVEKLLDTLFFKKKVEYIASLHEFSKNIITILELKKLIGAIVTNIHEIMSVKQIAFLLYEDTKSNYTIRQAAGYDLNTLHKYLFKDSFIIKQIEKHKEIIYREKLVDDKNNKILADQMKTLEALLLVPLFFNNKLLGIIILGKKYSEDAYTTEELTVLESIANQASIALSNALVYEDFNTQHQHLVELKNNLEEKVELRTRQLQEEHENKTNFFVNIAHEIKTPLTLISNYLDKDINLRGSSEEIDVVKYNVGKLKNDIVNFMDLEKLKRGQMFFNHEQIINISSLIMNKLPLFNEIAQKKNLTITSKVAGGILLKADPAAIDRVINNLLDNAIKYTGDQGNISILLEESDLYVVLAVSDDGIGISAEQQQNIFLPYHQVSHEKRNTQGIGMGLYIVKMIVDSLSGMIELKSELNEGSEFILTFAKTAHDNHVKVTNVDCYNSVPAMRTPVRSKLVERKVEPGKYNILLVEDNIDLLAYVKSALEDDYNVFVAVNGKKALAKLETIPRPDIIISDIMMDVMDGYDFFNAVSDDENYFNIPFIFLTARSTIDDKIKALSDGAIDYISKPFSIEELIAKINTILKNRKIQQVLYEKDKFATLGMLTGGICHEIANPLFMIYSPIDLLELELSKLGIKDNENITLYIERIVNNVKRIEKTLAGLKFLYHQKKLVKEKVDLENIVVSLKEVFQNKIKSRIELNFIMNESFDFMANEEALSHILLNLISNAIDAIKEEGRIDIIVENRDSGICLIVKDTGMGIDKKILPHLFNAFYTNKEVGKGTGLGLYIVKDLVMKLGWNILVNSEAGKGTEFVIQLL